MPADEQNKQIGYEGMTEHVCTNRLFDPGMILQYVNLICNRVSVKPRAILVGDKQEAMIIGFSEFAESLWLPFLDLIEISCWEPNKQYGSF